MKNLDLNLACQLVREQMALIVVPILEINHPAFSSPLRFVEERYGQNYTDTITTFVYTKRAFPKYAINADRKSAPDGRIEIQDMDRFVGFTLESVSPRDKFSATTGFILYGYEPKTSSPIAVSDRVQAKRSGWRILYSIRRENTVLALSDSNFGGAVWPWTDINPVNWPAAFNQGVN